MRSDAAALSRIGIVEPRSEGWTGGSTFIRTVAHSLRNACSSTEIEVCLVTEGGRSAPSLDGLPLERIATVRPGYRLGERRLRRLLGRPERSELGETARLHRLSVLLASFWIPPDLAGRPVLAWIPDFQHVHLPELFSEEELGHRNGLYRELADRAALVLVSSREAERHFATFAPVHAEKARVCPFPSIYVFEAPPDAAAPGPAPFNLPEKFALIINQFWRHKNHAVVVEALALLKERGLRVPVVMVGLPADYRDPTNRAISDLLQSITRASLHDQVIVLGFLPQGDLVDLLRRATVVIQPSRFEGWSTVVQDCKALGRPVICSDLPVHREQIAAPLGFFPYESPEALAALLEERWEGLVAGPDAAAEREALVAERAFAEEHGRRLLEICREARSRARER